MATQHTNRFFFTAGANTNVLDEKRKTAFLAAIVEGHVEVVSHFLQLSKISQYERNCGLYSAITYKHDEDLVEVLLKAGADPNFEAQLQCPELGELSLAVSRAVAGTVYFNIEYKSTLFKM